MNRRTPSNSRQRGFSFIEILVVMSIIVVLASAVAVVIPRVLAEQKKTGCVNNVRNMLDLMFSEYATKPWPPYDGKNFVLSLFAARLVDPENPRSIEGMFCPGDALYTKDKVDPARYKELNKDTLKASNYHELTSYAGRLASQRDSLITQNTISKGKPLICDDDEGPLHHPNGLVIGHADRAVKFMTWEDLKLPEPTDPDNPDEILGENSPNEDLKHLSSN